MVVAFVRIDLRLPGCHSLKDKRAVLRSLIDKTHHDFRASIAEVDDHELWGNATIGVAVVAAGEPTGKSILEHIVNTIADRPDVEIAGLLMDAARVD